MIKFTSAAKADRRKDRYRSAKALLHPKSNANACAIRKDRSGTESDAKLSLK
jgi:hypothetical protein